MMTITIGGVEYKVRFSYNRFCDSDLMDRTTEALEYMKSSIKAAQKDKDYTKKLFVLVRELLYEGFLKHNPKTKEEIGDLLDDYFDEGTEEEPHGLLDIFTMIISELVARGFIGDLLAKSAAAMAKTMEKVETTEKITQN